MIKDKPEVGDVFEHNNKLYYLYHRPYPNGYFECIVLYEGQIDIWIRTTLDFKDYKYLGKSKIKIEDLFNTERSDD